MENLNLGATNICVNFKTKQQYKIPNHQSKIFSKKIMARK